MLYVSYQNPMFFVFRTKVVKHTDSKSESNFFFLKVASECEHERRQFRSHLFCITTESILRRSNTMITEIAQCVLLASVTGYAAYNQFT